MRRSIAGLLCALLLILAGCEPMKVRMFTRGKGGEADPPISPVTVPFRIEGTHVIVVDVRVDGDSLAMILDTGGVTMIDSVVARKMGLEGSPVPEMQTMLYTFASSKIGEVEVRAIKAPGLDFEGTFQTGAMSVSGMIGSDWLRFFRTTFDYQSQSIVFEDPDSPGQYSGKVHVLDMGLTFPYMPTIDVVINGTACRAMIDTGLQYGFVLPLSMMEGLSPGEREKTRPARGFFTKWPSAEGQTNHLYTVGEIMVGDIRLKNQAVIFAELPPFIGEDILLIGRDFLERYRLSLDFEHREVVLSEVGIPPREIGYSVGLQLYREGSGSVVIGVWKDSPADIADIHPGDVIIEVNGRSVSDLTQSQIYDILTLPGTHTVSLSVLQGESARKVTLGKQWL